MLFKSIKAACHNPGTGFTAFGVSIEHVVLSNQSLALPSAEKWLLCDSTFLCLIALGILQMTSIMNNPSSSMAKSRRVIKYNAAIYSLVGAIVVLVLGAILKGSSVLPIVVIGIMAIVCIGQVILDVKRHPHHRFSKS